MVSICYVLKATGGNLQASSDAAASDDAGEKALLPLSEVPRLAFDHEDMIDHAREYIHGILSEV